MPVGKVIIVLLKLVYLHFYFYLAIGEVHFTQQSFNSQFNFNEKLTKVRTKEWEKSTNPQK